MTFAAPSHRLVGYDRVTDHVGDERDVPGEMLPHAKTIAHVPADDPEAAACWPLAAEEARALAGLLGVNIEWSRFDWFLEGFAP